MSTATLGRVPFIPHDALRALHVHEPTDDRFRAAARARQALLREAKGWPIGMWAAGGDQQRQLGSYLAEDHGDANFISKEVARLAHTEVAFREDGAMLAEDRLFRNLISSMPATFNLLGPLALRLRLATNVMKRICPGFVKKVDAVLFEHSPARRGTHKSAKNFTFDRSAFDALFKITTSAREHAFVSVEVKYTENLCEKAADLRPRYDELSQLSTMFVDPDHPALRTAPLQQLWRQHLLSFSLIHNGLYSAGRFIVIAPTLNRAVQEAVAEYRSHLLPGGIVPFDSISYSQVIEAIRRSGSPELADLLFDRYENFEPVDALIGG